LLYVCVTGCRGQNVSCQCAAIVCAALSLHAQNSRSTVNVWRIQASQSPHIFSHYSDETCAQTSFLFSHYIDVKSQMSTHSPSLPNATFVLWLCSVLRHSSYILFEHRPQRYDHQQTPNLHSHAANTRRTSSSLISTRKPYTSKTQSTSAKASTIAARSSQFAEKTLRGGFSRNRPKTEKAKMTCTSKRVLL
jgi:hypothetical protein